MTKTAEPNRREDILRAARQVFKNQGYAKARIEDIAKKAGVAKGTVYLYFKSKQAMLEALVDQFYDMMIRAAYPIVANPDSAEAVRESVHAAFETASRESDLVVLIDMRMGMTRDQREKIFANVRTVRRLTAFLKNCRQRGELYDYDPAVAAVLISGIFNWIVKLCLVWQADDLAKYEDTAIKIIQRGLFKNCPGESQSDK